MENLRGSGMIAGESSIAYNAIIIINLVSTMTLSQLCIEFCLRSLNGVAVVFS